MQQWQGITNKQTKQRHNGFLTETVKFSTNNEDLNVSESRYLQNLKNQSVQQFPKLVLVHLLEAVIATIQKLQ